MGTTVGAEQGLLAGVQVRCQRGVGTRSLSGGWRDRPSQAGETVHLRAYRGFVTGSEAAPWREQPDPPLRLQRVPGRPGRCPAVAEPRAGISLGWHHQRGGWRRSGHLCSAFSSAGTPMVKSAPGSPALGRNALSILSESLRIPLLTQPHSPFPAGRKQIHSFPLDPPNPSHQPFHLYGSYVPLEDQTKCFANSCLGKFSRRKAS